VRVILRKKVIPRKRVIGFAVILRKKVITTCRVTDHGEAVE
jgi:hypothetical protein